MVPAWMGTWLSVFPTVETLVAQAVASTLVLGSYAFVNWRAGAASRGEFSGAAAEQIVEI